MIGTSRGRRDVAVKEKELLWEMYEGFWEGREPCWRMCHCPPAIKEECPASKYSILPCWEIEGTYCKLQIEPETVSGTDTSICKVCRVYKTYGRGRPIELKLFGKGINSSLVSLERLARGKALATSVERRHTDEKGN